MKKKTKNFAEIVAHVVMILFSLSCVLPFLLLIVSSFTDDKTLLHNGYTLFPAKLSMDAYNYLWIQKAIILRAYGITILVTVIGTIVSLIITSALAYAISRKEFPFRNFLAFYVAFTMLFSGGLVPTYIMYTHYFDMKNTLFALLIPGLLMNGFNVMIMRTFFQTNIPEAIIESALIDGAGVFKTFYSIVVPVSVPIFATIGLFEGIAYWNDWYNGLIYLTDAKLFNIQTMLNRILMNIQFLSTTNTGGAASAALSNMPTVAIRMAIAVVGMLPILAIYPYFQKYFAKGLTIGAVKG
jgi:putative aldouronate transport system permease protein